MKTKDSSTKKITKYCGYFLYRNLNDPGSLKQYSVRNKSLRQIKLIEKNIIKNACVYHGSMIYKEKPENEKSY